ncbi:MAG: hypothetical protein ACI81V_001435 [Lentimonas sp.]|jgi:hypothetical protein
MLHMVEIETAMHTKKSILNKTLLILLSLFSAIAHGDSFYTLTDDTPPTALRVVRVSDNAEFNSAISNASPGDRILLADGNYNGINLVGLKGTAQSPIVFMAENPRQAWISGSTSGRNARLSDCAYLEFRDLRFTGAQVWGVTMGPAYSSDSSSLGCNNIRIINCEIDHSGQLLLKVNGGSYNIDIIGNSLHDTGLSGSGNPYAEGIYIGDGGLMTDRSHDVLVQGNHLYNIGNVNNWGEAIDIKVKTYNITIVDNLIENVTVNSQGAITVLLNDQAYPAGMTNPNIVIARNVIHKVRRRSGGWNGTGISAGSNGVSIYNNLIWDTDEASITVTRNASNTMGGFHLYNNTLWDGVLINQSSVGTADQPVEAFLANNLIRGTGASAADRVATSADFIGPLTGSATADTYIGGGFQLDINSAAAGSGAVISYFNDDLSGVLRPSTAYSYGALEAIASDGTPPPPPPENDPEPLIAAINCGGSQYLATDGILYEADNAYAGGSTASRTTAISGTAEDPLYQSERYGPFSYAIPVQSGNYLVTLMFAETYWTGTKQRILDSLIEGQTVISQLDIYGNVGINAALQIQIPVLITDGTLNIDFTAMADKPKLSALRIELIPENLTSSETQQELLEAGLRVEPNSASDLKAKLPSTRIVIVDNSPYMEYTYRRIIGGYGDAANGGYLVNDILYTILHTQDLTTWNNGSVLMESVGPPINNGDNTESQVVRSKNSLTNANAIFMQLALRRI